MNMAIDTPMYRRSYPLSGRRQQDWGETKTRFKTIYVGLVVSLAIGLGSMFQTRVERPLPSASPEFGAWNPSPDYARYQWVGYHRLSPRISPPEGVEVRN
jgi:hypothetical protein